MEGEERSRLLWAMGCKTSLHKIWRRCLAKRLWMTVSALIVLQFRCSEIPMATFQYATPIFKTSRSPFPVEVNIDRMRMAVVACLFLAGIAGRAEARLGPTQFVPAPRGCGMGEFRCFHAVLSLPAEDSRDPRKSVQPSLTEALLDQ